MKILIHKFRLIWSHRLKRCFYESFNFLVKVSSENIFFKLVSLFISMLKFNPKVASSYFKGLRFDQIFVYNKCGFFNTCFNCSGQYSRRSFKISIYSLVKSQRLFEDPPLPQKSRFEQT